MSRGRVAVGAAGVACAGCLVVGAPVLWQAGATLVGVALLLRLVWSCVGHARVVSTMRRLSVPGCVDGVAVRWLPSTGVVAVAGLVRPAVFCDPEVLSRLTVVEQRAVVLHEVAHRRRRDPLHLVVLDSLAPLAVRVPPGRAWLRRRHAALEIRADQRAMGEGVPAEALASALLKVGSVSRRSSMAAFDGALDLRLAALLGDATPPVRRLGWLAVGAGVAAACTVMLTMDGHGLVDGVACVAGWCRR